MYKRPLCVMCAAFMLGILFVAGAGLFTFLVASAVSVITMVILFKKLKKSIGIFILALLFFNAGGLLYHNAEKHYICELNDFYGKQVVMEGYIDSELEKDGDKVNFTLKINKILEDRPEARINQYADPQVSSLKTYKRSISAKLLCCIYNGKNNNIYKNLDYRSCLSVRAIIEKPKPATNPGGFDYQRYLASIGVSGKVNIMNTSEVSVTGKLPGGLVKKLGYSIKNTVLGIVKYCLDKNQAGLLSGMIIGYKQGLDENAFNAFSKAGLTHIMVASGMNVAFLILPLTFLFKKMHMGRKPSSIIIIMVLVLFVFVTGFSASVVRAVIMGIIILTGQLMMRETDIYTSIAAAALILLFSNPYIIFDIGFQLSFGATLSLVMLYPAIKKVVSLRYMPEVISDTLAATLAAQIGVVPISLYYFNSVSLISVISNLLVVPTVQVITIIGFVMVFAGLVNINMAVLIGYINNSFLSFILFVTETCSKIPYASVKLPTPPIFVILIYYISILYVFKGRQKLKKYINLRKIIASMVLVLLPVILLNSLLPKPLEITFLDVGQGDSTFIRTAHGTKILIDGGGREAGSKSSFDIGQSVMVPYILDQGTKSLDIVIASHGHTDHTEGLIAVLNEIRVGMVILPDTDGNGFKEIADICRKKGIKIVKCDVGDSVRLDSETKFEVLNPYQFTKDSLAQESLNNSSLVLKLIYKNVSVLFTGDSELPVEERLLDTGTDVTADLVKIGHHGSVTSSCEAFLYRVRPKYAVISVGEHNRFGHPSQFVVDRIEERNIRLYRTDKCGAVIAKSYGSGFEFRTMLK